jgi:ketosteroid isomerase-like protein
MPRNIQILALSLTVLVTSAAVSSRTLRAEAPRDEVGKSTVTDSSDVLAVLTKFHASLAAGDSVTALALLAPDVLILESGGVETRAEYRTHHLPADIEFARAVPSTRTVVSLKVVGSAAWVVTTSVTKGQHNGRAVSSAGAELTTLHKGMKGWEITVIHWSSRRGASTG